MRKAQFTRAAMLGMVIVAFATPASSQTVSPRKTVGQTNPQASQLPVGPKQPGFTQSPSLPAEYNIGLIVKKVAALEAHVALLQKQNEALAGQVSLLQKQNETLAAQSKTLASQLKSQAAQGANVSKTSEKVQNLELRINQLDLSLGTLNSSYESHTHYMPPFGEQVLSSIPGMQEIANKAGVGYVKPQWENMRMLFRTQNSFGIDFTGPIYKKQ